MINLIDLEKKINSELTTKIKKLKLNIIKYILKLIKKI